MDERVVAEWRRTHPEEATAEYEFWSTRAAEAMEWKAERQEIQEEKRARKAAVLAAYELVDAGGCCSWDEGDPWWEGVWTDTDVCTEFDDEE